MKEKYNKLSTMKKFFMSLLATTVSIVLTFGTTAIIDRRKQKAEKRELVMMVMYDMRESLKEIEQSEEELKTFCDLQADIVAHPGTYADKQVGLMTHIPILTYSHTTENIFKSSIETINTIGNILFVETVSSFYDIRGKYRTEIVDKFIEEGQGIFGSYASLAAFDAPYFPYFGGLFVQSMRRDFEECKFMMKVSEEDLDVFSAEREKVEKAVMGETAAEGAKKIIDEKEQWDRQLRQAREEGRKALENPAP